jgi:hypothetical protein
MNARHYWKRIFLLIILCVWEGGCVYLEDPQTAYLSSEEELAVEIRGGYKGRFGNLLLEGLVNRPAMIYVDGNKAADAHNNRFTLEVQWDVGEPILIMAEDRQGNTKEIEFWPDREPPEKPENLRVIHVTPNSVEFEWNENDEPDIAGYKVYYGLKGSGAREVPGIVSDNKHEIVGLKNFIRGANRTFQFSLRAVDAMGNESQAISDVLEVTVPAE